ncbi:MAG: endonuclease/exonuclease/phosphatase family protein [Bacteroidales bacterium]|nr:endonuclease/exonuclease/phosphatase family protein [Bacteroidales bacterium]
MSYNVENFFDPEDDPNKRDEDFTPDGSYHWTVSRMEKKAERLARVIACANGSNRPAVIGLCEVEGESAVKVLAKTTGLTGNASPYRHLCYPTPDGRGVAVAMLYDELKLELLNSLPIYVSIPDSNLVTRDVLYARFRVRSTADTVHVMVNHWPSMYGGASASVWKRDYVATRVRHVCDTILAADHDAKIVILGDFNTTADSPSISDVLGAKVKDNTSTLRNLSADTKDCSYRYRGEWQTIDHIIVSSALCRIARPVFSVVKFDFLLEEDDRYPGLKPCRTYLGRRFNPGPDNNGGYSDHLPVMVKILL